MSAPAVGNDVVDLRDADARPAGRHPRFDQLAFTAEERRWIGAGPGAERRRWSLWAAKEAAHKALRQEEAGLGFAPRRYRVRLDASGEGEVRCGERRIGVRVLADHERVHAIAFRGDPRAVRCGLARVAPAEEPGAAARRLLLSSFPAEDAARLERRDRIPRVRAGSGTFAASLSHHGRLVAFARAVDPTPESAS